MFSCNRARYFENIKVSTMTASIPRTQADFEAPEIAKVAGHVIPGVVPGLKNQVRNVSAFLVQGLEMLA